MIKKICALLFLTSVAYATPVRLRCEYLDNPLGIDAATPQLSWQSDNTERNWIQSAYQILVASSLENLNKADVWDSGKQNSGESVGILYGGSKLESRKRYYWKVRTWDAGGQASESEPAWWEMGLLDKADWKAKWITWKNSEEDTDWKSVRWIWVPGQDAFNAVPKAVAAFHLDFKISQKPQNAAIFVVARGAFQVKINGKEVSSKSRWTQFDRQEIGDRLVAGKNSVDVTVTVTKPEQFGPETETKPVTAAMGALLKVVNADGKVMRFATGRKWKAQVEGASKWKGADVVGDLNDQRLGVPAPMPQPAALMRHSFTLSKKVQAARLYATALGSYRMFLNGSAVSNDIFTPDFTDYRKRVLYQVYDVTSSLVNGNNSIAAMLGDGWFSSSLTWSSVRLFPPPNRLAAQLEIDYADGTHETLVSDESWKAAQSPILHSEIYAGEVYDARQEQADWNKAGFDDSRWASAIVAAAPSILVSSQITAPVQITENLQPKTVTPFPNGTYVFDMGQNMVGWVTLKVSGTAGAFVRLRFAEILNPDGSIYRENLRNADATDTYVLRGGGEETFTPHFTFHGFRYVEVSGFPGQPTPSAITGDVATSIHGEPTGRLTTSSNLVNEMWSIGLWGQRGNFLSIPTDCPQRDERLGWMGDAGVFWRTGTYNYDIAAFSQKFMNDVTDAQTPEGAFTNVSPDVLSGLGSIGAPGWGDAGVIIPYTAWLQYGNRQIIRQHWDAMERWMKFLQDANPNFIREKGVGPNFADWLAPDEHTDKTLLATAYWALVANMMSEMAHAVGKEDDAQRYADVVGSIRAAYQKAYIKDDGTVGTGTQTSYVVTLYTRLAPQSLEPKLVENLVKDIEARNGHLSTGFLGTPFLLSTLSNHGRTDVAYKLLLNETYPSWGYMLSKGATTWWERWNGDTGDPSMNSYNHYAFGSVVAWVYRYVAGIDTTTAAPAFHEIVIHPRPDDRITKARAEYDSVYGKIVSDWDGTLAGPFTLNVEIPANTSATVYLPSIPNAQVTEGGRHINVKQESESYTVQVGSGSYQFQVK